MAENMGMFGGGDPNPWMGNTKQAQAGADVAANELLYYQTGGQKGALPPVGYQTPQSGPIDYSKFTQGAQSGTQGPTTGQQAWTSAVQNGQVYQNSPGSQATNGGSVPTGSIAAQPYGYESIAQGPRNPYSAGTTVERPRANNPLAPTGTQQNKVATGGLEPHFDTSTAGFQTAGAEPSYNNPNRNSGPFVAPTDPWATAGGLFGSQPNSQGGQNNQPAAPIGSNYQGMKPPTQGTTTGVPQFNFQEVPNLPNGTPNYLETANQQAKYNLNNAQQQSNLNNPNYYGPGGSQVRTQNPDGSYSVTQSLSPELQQAYNAQNALQNQLLNKAGSLANNELSYNGIANAPTYNTSAVSGIPDADARNLQKTRNAQYAQQVQYLDPQFQQSQSDMEVKLANQGVMPGSAAYLREMNNFNLNKQKAYDDARNSAILAGGAEQSRQFGLGLQQHQAGINDATTAFNAGMQGRQQGVSEANALHNSPINDLSALRSGPQVQLPTYPGQAGTNLSNVDYLGASQRGYEATTGVNNANSAKNAQLMAGLFGLGNTFLQSETGQKLLKGLFGGGDGGTDPLSGTLNLFE